MTILIAVASGLFGAAAGAWIGLRLARKRTTPSPVVEVMPVNAEIVRLLNEQLARAARESDVVSSLMTNALLDRQRLVGHLERQIRGDDAR